MPMDDKGKHRMNPNFMKGATDAPPKDTAPADGYVASASNDADPDAGAQMITCPSCGAQFPEEMGLMQPEAAAQPAAQSSGAPSGMSGY